MSETTLTLVQFLRDGLDPVPELARLRAEHPVSPLTIPNGPTAWLVSSYRHVRQVLGDAETFSNDFANVFAAGGPGEDRDPGGLGMADPPKHTRLRKMLTGEFTARRLRELEPSITAVIEQCLDRTATAGADGEPVDLVRTFAQPIPSLVICELLGVPAADRADFQRISNNRFDVSGAASAPGGGLDAVGESLEFLGGLVAQQRAEPGDGLLGRLIREHGARLTDRELAGLADGLLTGGHDTTASMLALGTLLLLEDPALRRTALDPDRVGDLVEELLRYISVVQVAFPRWARRDAEIAGQRISAGDMVVCSLSAANRDPELQPGQDPALASGLDPKVELAGDDRRTDMDRVDPGRRLKPHLAFGYGIHHCVGAQLARLEMAIAYPALLRRFPTLRLAQPRLELSYRPVSIVYGVTSLPVTW